MSVCRERKAVGTVDSGNESPGSFLIKSRGQLPSSASALAPLGRGKPVLPESQLAHPANESPTLAFLRAGE